MTIKDKDNLTAQAVSDIEFLLQKKVVVLVLFVFGEEMMIIFH
jgi:hypothetical protein